MAIEAEVAKKEAESITATLPPIDVTAPMDVNAPIPDLLPTEYGTTHPLMREIETISDIFNRMGFVTEESREISIICLRHLIFLKDIQRVTTTTLL